MKIGINLATQPFRRDRPVVVVSSLLAVVLLAMLGVLVYLDLAEDRELKDARVEVAQLQKKIRRVAAEQAQTDAVLRRPENAEVLERSLFINQLLYRKGISWTKILADLEKVVPHNVRIMSIKPTLNAQNEVALDMQVGAEQPEPIIALLKALEGSPLFGEVYQHNTVPPTQNDPLWKYRVSVNYAQKP